MKVSVLLADKGKANPQQGTVDLLNVGWSIATLVTGPTGLMTGPQAVAVFYEVELARCNKPLDLLIELVNADGSIVELPGPAGPQLMQIRQSVTIRIPPAPTGTPGTGNALIEMYPGIPLAEGRYNWNVTLDGEHEEDWTAGFYVSSPQQPPVSFGATSPKSS